MGKTDRLISFFSRSRSILLRVEDGILVTLVVMIIGMAVTQILLRNFLDTGVVWGDILVRIMVLWIGMVGAMVASRRGEHISIDILSRFMSPRIRNMVNGFVQFTTCMICSIATYYSVKFVMSEDEYGGNAFATVPVWLCEAINPFAFFVIALRYFLLSIQNLTRINKFAS